MCICQPCCLIFGRYKKKKIDIPNNSIVLPDKILCMNCGNITNGVYYETYNKWLCCFIPCFCSSSVENPKMGCSSCEFIFKINPIKCENCKIYNIISSKYCPNCGKSTGNI